MITAQEIIDRMTALDDEHQRAVLSRFFKTAPGEYGYGDKFLGIKVPQTRAIVKEVRLQVPLDEIHLLLGNEYHEIRLCGFLLLVEEMKPLRPSHPRGSQALAERRDEIAQFYLHHSRQADNWDLVDLSCPYIIGEWLLTAMPDGTTPSRDILDRLAASDNLWDNRIAIVSTLMLIRHGQFDDTLRIARALLHHPNPLIHKAIGWMLREIGKRDIDTLRRFLRTHYPDLPRTSLRYAIERMDADERHRWLHPNDYNNV